MASRLVTDFDGPIATLTINRPDKANALSSEIWKSFPTLISELCARRETRVIIVRGQDGNFAAGADIAEFDTVFANRSATLASQAAKSGFVCAQAYTASKHGLVGLARSAAIELGPHGITVNNVCPNHVTTGLGAWQNEYFARRAGKDVTQYLADMASNIPLGRPGLPEDTANAVAFLCSTEASYITAESLNVSGGEEPH